MLKVVPVDKEEIMLKHANDLQFHIDLTQIELDSIIFKCEASYYGSRGNLQLCPPGLITNSLNKSYLNKWFRMPEGRNSFKIVFDSDTSYSYLAKILCGHFKTSYDKKIGIGIDYETGELWMSFGF